MDFTPGKPLRTYTTDGQWRDWSTEELVGQSANVYTGWKCGAGVDSIYIGMDGEVSLASCGEGGLLGNVWSDFRLPGDWVTCTKPACTCGADLFIPKVQTFDLKNLLRRTSAQSTEVDKRNDQIHAHAAVERTHASNQLQVYWEIGRRCNYDCGYCWPWVHNNTDSHKSLETLMQATKLIEDRFTKGKPVNFIISGGEPTVNKNFMPWIQYLNSCGHKVSLHSNGTRLPSYYREVVHFGDLNLSVHYEFYDRAKFVKVVEAVAHEKATTKGCGHLEIKYMMAPQNKEETLSLIEELKALPHFSNYCTHSIVPIRGSMENKIVKFHERTNENSGSQIMKGYAEDDYKLFGIVK